MLLAANGWDESREDIQKCVDELKLKHRILLNARELRSKYNAGGIPALYWIDRQGVIVDVELDFHGPKSLEQKTRRLLGKG